MLACSVAVFVKHSSLCGGRTASKGQELPSPSPAVRPPVRLQSLKGMC